MKEGRGESPQQEKYLVWEQDPFRAELRTSMVWAGGRREEEVSTPLIILLDVPVCAVATDLAPGVMCHLHKGWDPSGSNSVTFKETVQQMKQMEELFSCCLHFSKYHLWKSNVSPIAILTKVSFHVFPIVCTPGNCLFEQTLPIDNCLRLFPSLFSISCRTI